MKYAVVDIGSNSVRLLITDGERSLLRRLEITRLSQGLNSSGVLCDEAMQRTRAAILSFDKIAKENNCDEFYAFATEAVRSAKNGSDFVGMLKKDGVDIDVIAGEVEAKIGFMGAYTSGRVALADIGGASTELAIGDDKGLIFGKSLKVGCVRLKESFGEDVQKLREYCSEKVKEYGAAGIKFDKLYSIGGSASTLASVDAELEEYDENTLHHRVLSAERIENIVDMIHNTPMEKRHLIKGLEDGRKDIIVGSGILLLCIMEYLGVNEVINSETSNIEGYLKYRLAQK